LESAYCIDEQARKAATSAHLNRRGLTRYWVYLSALQFAMAAALQPSAPTQLAVVVPELIFPCQALWGGPTQRQQHNSSHCHPVFFTDKLRRPPFSLLPGLQSSPVAHGYVYQDAPRGSEKVAGPRL